VPAGATRITQSATTARGATSFARDFAKPKVKNVTGACRIKTTGKGKKAQRTYTCTIRLSKARWIITTKALNKATVIAQSVKVTAVK
jgi:hypothetical protein